MLSEKQTKNYYFNEFWHLVICQIKSKAAIIKYTFKFKDGIKCVLAMYYNNDYYVLSMLY